jgi:hypothetical protein
MSFWDLSDGQTAVDTPKEYEVSGGSMEPIPNNSDVLAIVDQAKWADKDGAAYVELRWAVMAPEAVKGRKVFHKLWVTDLDPNAKDEAKGKAKRDKARRMLASIDANAGGNLTRTGEAPTDETLTMHLCNKPMVIKVMVWSMKGSDGTDMAGNWVSAVSPSDKPLQISSEPLPKTSAAPAPSGGGGGYSDGLSDSDIPF